MFGDQTVGFGVASSGDNTVIAAPTDGRRIMVKAVHGVAAGAVTLKVRDGASGAYLMGSSGTGVSLTATSPLVMPYCSSAGGDRGYWWVLSPNTALIFNLGGAVGVAGTIVYRIAGA